MVMRLLRNIIDAIVSVYYKCKKSIRKKSPPPRRVRFFFCYIFLNDRFFFTLSIRFCVDFCLLAMKPLINIFTS